VAEPSAIAFLAAIGVTATAPLAQLKRDCESTPPTAVIQQQATRAARSGCIPARFQRDRRIGLDHIRGLPEASFHHIILITEM